MQERSSPPRRSIAARSSPGAKSLPDWGRFFKCPSNPPPNTIDLSAALAQASDSFETVRTSPEDVALLHFTSGTTGRPKGAVHAHEAVVAHHITG